MRRRRKNEQRQGDLKLAGDQVNDFDAKQGSKDDKRATGVEHGVATHVAEEQESARCAGWLRTCASRAPAVQLPLEGQPAAKLDGFKPKRVFLARVSESARFEMRSAQWLRAAADIGVFLRLVGDFDAFVDFNEPTARCDTINKNFFGSGNHAERVSGRRHLQTG